MISRGAFLQLVAGLLLVLFPGRIPAVGQNFFPKGTFHPDNVKLDAFVAEWYSKQLTALEEPSLFAAKQDSSVQSYRFLWLRTFHHPVSVRVTLQPDESGSVVTKVADGAGGYQPGKLIVNKTEKLPAEKMRVFLEKVDTLKYWTLPERDPERQGMDGAQWVIEGVADGKYRLVDRWTPKAGAVRELGLYFLRRVSTLDLKNQPIY
jgi:hypothetical protein